jgi:hypothetical protein
VTEYLVAGNCFVCGMPNVDHTIAQMDRCLDQPLAIIVIIEEEDQDQ